MLISTAHAATELRPGILAAPDSGMVLTMHPGGGIDALSITDGQVLWHSTAADKPLLARQGQLLGQVDAVADGMLELAILEITDGRVSEKSSLPLPAGVRAAVDDGLGTRFNLGLRGEGQKLTLGWDHSKRVVQGMMSANRPDPKRTSGGLSVDLASAQFEAVDAAAVPKRAGRSPIEGRFLKEQEGRQFISSDGQHVLVSEHDAAPGPPRYRWLVYSRDGALVGSTRSRVSFSPFVVVDGMLLYTTNPVSYRTEEGTIAALPRLLRGIDLATGLEVWTAEIRDTAYRGPYPP
ncbi:MAG: hypothetical protein AAGA23_11685 [Pseudomonadota bacterium]